MSVYYRWYHTIELKVFSFSGPPLDMQCFNVTEQMESAWKFRAQYGERQKKRRQPASILMFRFRTFAPDSTSLHHALSHKPVLPTFWTAFRDNQDLTPVHPKETLEPDDVVVLKRLPRWVWQETMDTTEEHPIDHLYPATASEEDKMYINMRICEWKRPKVFQTYCFICNDPNHLQSECPQRRICGFPKGMDVLDAS